MERKNTLVFQVKSIYFKRDAGRDAGGLIIYAHDVWKSKGSSDQSLYYSLNTSTIATKLIRPTHIVLSAGEYFQGINKIITNDSIVNIYIVYKLSPKTITTDNAFKKIVCLVQSKQVDLMILQILINIL